MKQFKEDDIIVKQGDISDEMYKIVYGKAAVFINHGEKNEHLIGILAEQ
ncbi:MAG: cyclic nucleotide-binding domain-containing protein, partial [Oscillospiraceae bacterium]|nr:cyclic nucleotide-binding domain-containing protein [Oscillospiraceae bacterium]